LLVERFFERVLWLSRLVVVIPVVASVALACAAFYLGTVDVVYVLAHLGSYADLAASAGTRAATRAALLGTIIKAVDIYLVAAILLIFASACTSSSLANLRPPSARTLRPASCSSRASTTSKTAWPRSCCL